jgi:hypothetical protein
MRKKEMKYLRKLGKRVKGFFKKDYHILLPQIYFIVLVAGFLLGLLYAFFPFLVTCLTVFGSRVCTSVGVLTSLAVNVPGYLVIGKIFGASSSLPTIVSVILVVFVSALFYFLLGHLIDNFKKGKGSAKNSSKSIIYISLFLLIFLLILFL